MKYLQATIIANDVIKKNSDKEYPLSHVELLAETIQIYETRIEQVDVRRVNHKIKDIMKDLKLCVDAIEGITSQSDFKSDVPNYMRKKYEL